MDSLNVSPNGSKGRSRVSNRNLKRALNRALNSPSEEQYPPLPIESNYLAAISTSLFTENAPAHASALLDTPAIRLISKNDVEMVNVVESDKKHGQGAFGYVKSAEIEFKLRSHNKKLIGAIKVSRDETISKKGISYDMLNECAVYSRILKSKNLAKGVFASFTANKQVMILEHYGTTLSTLFRNENMNIPWNIRSDLIRAIFFQIVSGLHELHALGFLHKDLKPANILTAYDGRVLIADFGLSSYLVKGSDIAQDFYMRWTTATIEPPEGNYNQHLPIGKSYDIWSLGCTFSYLVSNVYGFDMYTAGEGWRKRAGLPKYYGTVIELAVEYFSDNLAEKVPRPSLDLLKQGGELMRAMLQIEPTHRISTKDILANPWFEGLTLERAIADVRRILSENKSLVQNAYGNVGRTKLIRNTRKIANANANAHKNTNVTSYFRIIPQTTLPTRFLTREIHEMVKPVLKSEFFRSFNKPCSIYTYFHALELFNRLVHIYEVDKYAMAYFYICVNIALKVSPARDNVDVYSLDELIAFINEPIAFIKRPVLKPADLLNLEINAVKLFNGDMYPQTGGLLDNILTKLGGFDAETDRKGVIGQIMRKILLSSENIHYYTDIKRGDLEVAIFPVAAPMYPPQRWPRF